MISFLKGKIEEKGMDFITIDVNGVGYKIYMPVNSLEILEENKDIKVFTYMRVLQDDVSLYGFLTKEEINMFELLISVGGIGAKSAITILGNISPSKFALAVISEDIDTLKKLQGIGPKTAGRIILELKDKIKKENESLEEEVNKSVKEDKDIEDVIGALQVLGYRRYQINNVISKVQGNSLEDKIKDALKYLAK